MVYPPNDNGTFWGGILKSDKLAISSSNSAVAVEAVIRGMGLSAGLSIEWWGDGTLTCCSTSVSSFINWATVGRFIDGSTSESSRERECVLTYLWFVKVCNVHNFSLMILNQGDQYICVLNSAVKW